MRVIWSWNNEDNHAIDFKEGHQLRVALLLASVHSWKNQYPEDKTVLYCCKETERELKKYGVDSYWDEIAVLDYGELLDEYGVYNTPSWGAPKLAVIPLQTEPFAILDCDTVTLGDFKSFLNPQLPWVYARYNLKNVKYDKASSKVAPLVTDLDKRFKHLSYTPGWNGRCYNTSIMYFPDTKFAQDYAETVLFSTKEMYELGGFQGKTRKDSDIPFKYIMTLDEETLYHMLQDSGQDPEILCELDCTRDLFFHETDKYNLHELKYKHKVGKYLTLANLPKNYFETL